MRKDGKKSGNARGNVIFLRSFLPSSYRARGACSTWHNNSQPQVRGSARGPGL